MIDVKLEKFEGPLGLLVQLIEKEELDITQISLANIADQYINYIQDNGNIDSDLSADFLVIASKLLFIKSKTLLPYINPEEEETEELEQQLKMFKEFLDASHKVAEIIKNGNFMFSSGQRKEEIAQIKGDNFLFSPPQKITKQDLTLQFQALLNRKKNIESQKLEEAKIEHKINLEEKTLEIQRKLVKRLSYNFSKLTGNFRSRTEVIISFLAILELSKQNSVKLEQEEAFSDILVTKNTKKE